MDLRRTLAVSAICLGYAVFGTVVWSAHRHFGMQARSELAPLVASAATPLKLPAPLLESEVAAPGAPLPVWAATGAEPAPIPPCLCPRKRAGPGLCLPRAIQAVQAAQVAAGGAAGLRTGRPRMPSIATSCPTCVTASSP